MTYKCKGVKTAIGHQIDSVSSKTNESCDIPVGWERAGHPFWLAKARRYIKQFLI